MDTSQLHPDEEVRHSANQLVEILIPVVKGYATECGLENVSLALQVHGGMGFIEETGAAQFYRDQRITPIYEGTTGIQGLDLIGRKTIRDQGETCRAVIEAIRSDINQLDDIIELLSKKEKLNDSLKLLEETIESILQLAKKDIRIPAAICEPYLKMWGVIACGWQMIKASAISIELSKGNSDSFYSNKIQTADFYFNYELPKALYLKTIILNSAEDIADTDEKYFDEFN